MFHDWVPLFFLKTHAGMFSARLPEPIKYGMEKKIWNSCAAPCDANGHGVVCVQTWEKTYQMRSKACVVSYVQCMIMLSATCPSTDVIETARLRLASLGV